MEVLTMEHTGKNKRAYRRTNFFILSIVKVKKLVRAVLPGIFFLKILHKLHGYIFAAGNYIYNQNVLVVVFIISENRHSIL